MFEIQAYRDYWQAEATLHGEVFRREVCTDVRIINQNYMNYPGAAMGRNDAFGFTVKERSGEIIIFQNGRKAATLRGAKAAEFRDSLHLLSFPELQQLMARLTGNYKHGNERVAKDHPRNRR